MEGKLYIDGQDAYVSYGIFVALGGYKELVCFPPLKLVDGNDWAEEDGVEADLSDPKLDTKEVAIAFAAHKEMLVGDFFELISDKAYHTFDFRTIGRAYKLRLVDETALVVAEGLQTFTLKFANDFPLPDGYAYEQPSGKAVAETGYELDGRKLSDYGVAVLQGTKAEILKSPAVKKNLLQNISSQSGATYDGKNVVFQTKEVKLSCHMRASTLEEFWRNHSALLYDLVRPNARSLFVEATGYEYECHYKSCSVKEFKPAGKIWLEFSLVFAFTSFRVDGDEFLLTTEEGELLVTEEDEVVIDLGF